MDKRKHHMPDPSPHRVDRTPSNREGKSSSPPQPERSIRPASSPTSEPSIDSRESPKR